MHTADLHIFDSNQPDSFLQLSLHVVQVLLCQVQAALRRLNLLCTYSREENSKAGERKWSMTIETPTTRKRDDSTRQIVIIRFVT